MKKLLLSALTFMSVVATAQLRTPSPSPSASLTQTVGTTDLTIKYSRPSTKGREIFGKLLAYDKVWRTGANAATQFTSSTDIMVEGQKLAAGTYSLFSIPMDGHFTVIFNKDAGASEQSYSQEKDALRVHVMTQPIPMKQSFGIDIEDITDSSATMNIAWERTQIPVKLAVDVDGNVAAGIEKMSNDNANNNMNAANYLLGKGKNLEQALKLADLAIGSKETFRNVWTKAQILSKLGRNTEALPLAQKALSLGSSDTSGAFGFFKDGIEKGIAEITSKIPAVVPAVIKKKKK
jgi:tetratricopeptide (TPR) repeat protein